MFKDQHEPTLEMSHLVMCVPCVPGTAGPVKGRGVARDNCDNCAQLWSTSSTAAVSNMNQGRCIAVIRSGYSGDTDRPSLLIAQMISLKMDRAVLKSGKTSNPHSSETRDIVGLDSS